MQQIRMPRVVMRARVAAPSPGVHGFPLDGRPVRSSYAGMSRETVNLICDELPGSEKVAGPGGEDIWTLAHEPFARVGEGVEIREGSGWAALPPLDDRHLRQRIVAAYESVRDSLPPDVRVTLDRTSG
jgi:hypothetical protein